MLRIWAGATLLQVAVLASVVALIVEAVLKARSRSDAQSRPGMTGSGGGH